MRRRGRWWEFWSAWGPGMRRVGVRRGRLDGMVREMRRVARDRGWIVVWSDGEID